MRKRYHDYKGYASTSNDEILNFFNPELQLKYAKYATRNKPKDSFKRFKFAKFALEFKKIERDDKTKYNLFYSNSKAEAITNKSDLSMEANHSIVPFYQTCKNLLQKGQAGLLIQL